MSGKVKMYLILIAIIFVAIIFGVSIVYFKFKATEYRKSVENDLVRLSLFSLKSSIRDFEERVSSFLKKNEISSSNLKSLSEDMCKMGCSFVLWMDTDGNELNQFGSVPNEDIYNSDLIQSVLYEEDYTFLSDLFFTKSGIEIRSTGIVKTKDGKELLVVAGKTLPKNYFSEIGKVIHRNVFFISKDGRVFGRGFHIDPKVLNEAEEGQKPETTFSKNGMLVSVIPLFDFEEWNVKGFLVNFTAIKKAMGKISGFIIFDLLLLSITLAFFIWGILLAGKRRNAATKILYIFSIPLLISIFVIFTFQTSKSLGSEHAEYIRSMARVLNGHGEIWAGENRLDEMKKILNIQAILREDGKILAATLKKNLLDKLDNWKSLETSGPVRIGEVDVNKVEHSYLRMKVGNKDLIVMKEKTVLINNIVKSEFVGIILLTTSIFFVLILGFSIKNAHRPRLLKATLIGYSFLAPALIHLLWWAAGPVVFSLFLAFHRWNVIDPAKPFVGLENFKILFQDKLFWNAMKNTAIFSLQVPISMFLSLLLALGVNRRTRSMALLRTIYYLPAVTSGVSTIIVWRWILNKEYGILNYILGFFGIPKVPWLTSPRTALIAIMIMSIWQALGSQMIIFLAGLQSIPQAFYDAASVDGANRLQKFQHITLPLLKPTSLFVLVTSIIGSFQIFTPVYVLTQGGPLRSTDVVFYHIWEAAWIELKMGYAAAQSWMLFVVLLVLTYMEFKFFGKESWKQYF